MKVRKKIRVNFHGSGGRNFVLSRSIEFDLARRRLEVKTKPCSYILVFLLFGFVTQHRDIVGNTKIHVFQVFLLSWYLLSGIRDPVLSFGNVTLLYLCLTTMALVPEDYDI